jgi:hypothetical protein
MKTNNTDRVSVGDNTLKDRVAMRKKCAHWVRKQHPQQWDLSREALVELIDMLGLQEEFDPLEGDKPTPRTSVRDCGPIPDPKGAKS